MQAALSMPTPAELLHDASVRLQAAGIDTARLDAEVLLAFAMRSDRAGLYARLHRQIDAAVARQFGELLARRARREPTAYITGTQEFWSLSFAVSPAVLIPRPETELLVEIAVETCGGADGHARTRIQTNAPCIADVGTGSGCIAIALARELPQAQIIALDSSAEALGVASRNAARHGVADRIRFEPSDLFACLAPDQRFDVIVSNPPYCHPDDATAPEVAFEPRAALTAGADGLAVIRRLLSAAPQRLRPGGWLAMEFGLGQDVAVRAAAAASGLTNIEIRADLAGIPRVLVARGG